MSVLDELLAGCRLDRKRAEAARNLAPWCWASLGPGPEPGQALVISVAADQCSLWLLDPAGCAGGPLPCAAPGHEALQSFERAQKALSRSMALLWHKDFGRAPWRERLVRLVTLRDRPGVDHVRPLDGPSAGLAYLLSLASRASQLTLPPDLVASAGVNELGAVLPVGELRRKVQALARLAPRVRRVVVAAEQVHELEGLDVEVIGVSDCADAIRRVFTDERVETALVSAGRDPRTRKRAHRFFFQAAMEGRTQVLHWAPVARASGKALAGWTELARDERQELLLAHMVACRYASMPLSGERPDLEWVQHQPPARRAAFMAQLTQQCTDTGWPEPERVLSMAQPEADQAYLSPCLRWQGARARLLATLSEGQARQALQDQAAVARAYSELLEPWEATYGLSEWFRLAGALGDSAAYRAAEELREDIEDRGGLERGGRSFVDLGQARALVMLRREPEHALDLLLQVEQREESGNLLFLHSGALRWRARLLDGLVRSTEAEAVRARLAALTHRAARLHLALARLDLDPRADPGELAELPVWRRLVAAGLDPVVFYPY